MPEERIGVLFLADVMDYSSQSGEQRSVKTAKFDDFFEKNVKALSKEHGGVFIKRIGDAVLLFFERDTNFLDFVVKLRELSQNGKKGQAKKYFDIGGIIFDEKQNKKSEGEIFRISTHCSSPTFCWRKRYFFTRNPKTFQRAS